VGFNTSQPGGNLVLEVAIFGIKEEGGRGRGLKRRKKEGRFSLENDGTDSGTKGETTVIQQIRSVN